MYQPGYYSLRDLNKNTSNGGWSLHQQNNTFCEHRGIFLSRPAIDINEEYDKEQLRQTILKHDSMFRHQLYELHRLYKRQRDVMNEMRSKELKGHMIPAGTSKFSVCSSEIPVADDNGRQYASHLSVNHGRLSSSGADNIQFEFGSMKDTIWQSNYSPTQNGLRLKDCETLESGCKKLRGKLFDLELTADAYLDVEEEGQGVSEVSMVESYHRSRNHEMARDRDGNLSIQAGVNSGCNDDVLSANLHIRNPHGLSNLNEPIKVTKAYPSASTDVLGNIICSKEDIKKQFLSLNSHSDIQSLVKFSQDSGKRSETGASLSNMHLETERRQKGWLAYNIEARQSVGNGCSLSASFPREDFPTTSRSQPAKKKIFGVEICERKHGASVEDSHTVMQQSFVPLSNVAQSQSSSISSQRKVYSGFSKDMNMVQSSFTQSNKSSVTFIESPEFIADKLLVSTNPLCIPSINAEASSQNHLSRSSQLKSKESRVSFLSNGFSHLNGISDGSSASEQFARDGPKKNCRDVSSMMNEKSAEQKKADAKDSADRTSKQSPPGGLPWLKVVPLCNSDSSEESQGSSQMNLHSLPSSFKQLVDRTEMMRKSFVQSHVQDSLSATCALDAEQRRSETGECSSNKKILGFSISEKPSMPKELPSLSTPSKQSYIISLAVGNTNSFGVGLPNTWAQDAISPRFGEKQRVESRNEKGLINHSADSRRCIDLNLSFMDEGFEEEAQPTSSSSRTNLKNSAEIDLEAPAKVEAELDLPPGCETSQSKLNSPPESFRSNSKYPDVPPGYESIQSKVKEPVDFIQDESGKLYEELIRDTAEALVAISSSCMPLQVNTCCQQSTACPRDPLHWFVEIISCYKSAVENEVVHRNDIIPDEMDYFEYMTLNLAETKVEECCYQPQVFENPKVENILRKRPCRGHARRGRQRKDFQRDVLPTLSSLSKNEVTEDLQTIEGLIQATGGTWKSSLALKNTARNGPGRRKRPLETSEVCPPETQLPQCKEVALDDGNLTGWGKRTRRPPRQRCLISNRPLAIK